MPRVTITVPDRNPQPYRFQLDRLSVTLGRGEDNDIPIDSGSVSVRHAEMRRVEGGYELRDLGSTNGIKLNDERMDVIPLRNGASVTLGDVAFDFLLEEDELGILAQERAAVPVEAPRSLPELPPLPEVEDEPEPEHEEEVEVGSGVSWGTILLLVLLVLAAFFGGAAIRFQKETGKSLIHTLLSKREAAIIQTPEAAPQDAATAPN